MSRFEHKSIGWITKQIWLKKNNRTDERLVKDLETELMVNRKDEYIDWCRKNPKFLEFIWTGGN
jgi:hypothetical protein